jgi:RNA polymerase sigma factor (sigma-70 family)
VDTEDKATQPQVAEPPPDVNDQFWTQFDLDPEKAAAEYVRLHRKLTKFFGWKLPGSDAPALADETLIRVGRRIAEGERIENIDRYSMGVARNVYLETVRRPAVYQWDKNLPDPPDKETPESTAIKIEEETLQKKCFQHCLNSLEPHQRDLIINYYVDGRDDEARKQLAEELGIELATLRKRAQRIRDKLYKCVEECKGKGAA